MKLRYDLHNKRRFLITLLKTAVTFGVVALLIFRLGWDDIRRTVADARPIWLAVALLLFLLSIFIGVIQWRILLSNRGIPLPLGRSCRLYMIGMFFNNFVLGGVVGDVLKIASIRNRDGKGKAGLAATFLDRFAGLWAMSGFALAGSYVLLHRQGTFSSGKIGSAVVALFAAFLLFASIMALLVFKPLQRIAFYVLDRLPSVGRFRLHDILSEMFIEARDWHLLISVAFLSSIVQLMRIGVHMLAALSLDLLTSNNYHYFFIFVPIIAMLMTIPLPFGVREAAGGTLFTLAGFPQDAAYVMGFLASLVGLAASSIGGLFYITDRTFSRDKHENSIDRCASI